MSPARPGATDRGRTSAAIFGASLVLFFLTLFPGVGGLVNHGDSAKFQFLGVVPGVGHPPGNPLYLVLLELVQALPSGSPAMRANAASALCASLAVAIVADATHRLGGRLAAIVAALALALGGLYWTFATEAEVYALAAVFVALVFHALVRAELESDGKAVAVSLAVLGLGLANHLSLAFAVPAWLVTVVRLGFWGVRPTLRQGLLALLPGLLTLGLYAAIPYATERGLPYSEYVEPPTLEGLLAFVSAERFRSELAIPSLEVAIGERPLAMLGLFARQWMLPLWFAAPIGLAFLARRASVVSGFVVLALLGWLGFAFAYAIPDPDGFYVPIVVVTAPLIGLAVHASLRPWLAALLVVACLAPGVVLHLRAHRDAVPYDVLEDIGYGVTPEFLDLPDVIQRIPRGAKLTFPCSHYGCIEVTNYYRFADPAARAKGIELVTLDGGTVYPLPSPPRRLRPIDARGTVVCTVHDEERALLAESGVAMRTIPRGFHPLRGESRERIPVYCSVVDPARTSP